MGVNNEYGSDAFYFEDAREDEMLDEEDELVLDPESWHDWYSEDLLNMWFSLRQYCEDNYMAHRLLNKATFHSFCEYVRINS